LLYVSIEKKTTRYRHTVHLRTLLRDFAVGLVCWKTV